VTPNSDVAASTARFNAAICGLDELQINLINAADPLLCATELKETLASLELYSTVILDRYGFLCTVILFVLAGNKKRFCDPQKTACTHYTALIVSLRLVEWLPRRYFCIMFASFYRAKRIVARGIAMM